MATFHPFMKLPPELRVRVWYYAVAPKEEGGRVIELHSYNDSTGILSIAISSRYPTLFHVNREARCEAAKELSGEFVTIEAIPQALEETGSGNLKNAHNGKFEIFVDFGKDTFFSSERFCTAHDDAAALPRVKHHLEALAVTLPEQVLRKIQNIRLTCLSFSEDSEIDVYGNFLPNVLPNYILAVFHNGALAKVELIADGMSIYAEDLARHLEEDISKHPFGSNAPQFDWTEVFDVKGVVRLRHLDPYFLEAETTFDLHGLWTAKKIERNNTARERSMVRSPQAYITYSGDEQGQIKVVGASTGSDDE